MKVEVEYTETIYRKCEIEIPDELADDMRDDLEVYGLSESAAARINQWVYEQITEDPDDLVSEDCEMDSGFGVIESIEELK